MLDRHDDEKEIELHDESEGQDSHLDDTSKESFNSPRQEFSSEFSSPREGSNIFQSPRADSSGDFSTVDIPPSFCVPNSPRSLPSEHIANSQFYYSSRVLPGEESTPRMNETFSVNGMRLSKKERLSNTRLTSSSGNWSLINTVSESDSQGLFKQEGLHMSGKSVLGSGKYGTVRVAFDEHRASYVAVKKIEKKIYRGESEIHKLLTEAKIPGILPMYDAIYVKYDKDEIKQKNPTVEEVKNKKGKEIDDNKKNEEKYKLYIIMKIANGGSGEDLKKYQHLFDQDEWYLLIKFIAANLLNTLIEMNKQGFYHLDLKPDNFQLHFPSIKKDKQRGMEVLLNDFGSALKFFKLSSHDKAAKEVIEYEAGKKAELSHQAPEAYLLELLHTNNLSYGCDLLEAWRYGVTILELIDKNFYTHYSVLAQATRAEKNYQIKLEKYLNFDFNIDNALRSHLEKMNVPRELKEIITHTLCVNYDKRSLLASCKLTMPTIEEISPLVERLIEQRLIEQRMSDIKKHRPKSTETAEKELDQFKEMSIEKSPVIQRAGKRSQLRHSLKNTLSKSTQGLNAKVSGFFHRHKPKNDEVIEGSQTLKSNSKNNNGKG